MSSLRERFAGVHVLVIGDVMLDEYLLGAASRISPEAPVPVVEIKERRYVPGGAGNVAMNVLSLGARCSIVGVCGGDSAADTLRTVLGERGGMNVSGLVCVPGRATTCKTRVIAGQQQIVRFDVEERSQLADSIYTELQSRFREAVSAADICVLSDYGKGVLSGELCRMIIDSAAQRNIPVLADPKGLRFEKYRGCTLITPNQREAAQFTGIPIDTEQDVLAAGEQLVHALAGSAVLITRGPDGMTLFHRGQAPITIPTVARTVYDVVGAGDTAMATLGVSLGSGFEFPAAMHFANVAAGIAVGKQGTVAVSLQEVLEHAEFSQWTKFGENGLQTNRNAHLYSKT